MTDHAVGAARMRMTLGLAAGKKTMTMRTDSVRAGETRTSILMNARTVVGESKRNFLVAVARGENPPNRTSERSSPSLAGGSSLL